MFHNTSAGTANAGPAGAKDAIEKGVKGVAASAAQLLAAIRQAHHTGNHEQVSYLANLFCVCHHYDR